MQTHRFFLNIEDEINQQKRFITVNNKDLIHQFINVLRLTLDSKIEIEFIYEEKTYLCSPTKITKKQISFSFSKTSESKRELNRSIKFYIPVIKPEAFSLMLRKLTELGVQEFQPVLFERSQKKYSSNLTKKRLNKIMMEAVEQCGGGSLPKLNSIIAFRKLSTLQKAKKIFAYEGLADQKNNDFSQRDLLRKELIKEKNIELLIGPEGGLTDNEAKWLISQGFQAISLGIRLLKAETAAITIFSCLELF